MIRMGSSEGTGAIGLLSAAPYIFAVLLMLLAGYYSDRSSQRVRFVWPFLIKNRDEERRSKKSAQGERPFRCVRSLFLAKCP